MRVPVVILTGFLGSGKTTFLNQLLAAKPEHLTSELAIIVNEFGDVGIDGALLPAGVTSQVELPGGCICCSLDEDLQKTLAQLIADRPALGRIIVETTGIADPLPITWTLGADALVDHVRVEAVVTVVDVLHHARFRAESEAVDAQVRYADLIVLSKQDLGPADAAVAAVRAVNADAAIIDADAAHELWRLLADVERTPSTGAPLHRHGPGIESLAVPVPGVLDLELLEEELAALPASVLRLKGIARAVDEASGSDDVRWVAFHRVGTRFSYDALDARPSSAAEVMVALGKDLDRAALERVLGASQRRLT